MSGQATGRRYTRAPIQELEFAVEKSSRLVALDRKGKPAWTLIGVAELQQWLVAPQTRDSILVPGTGESEGSIGQMRDPGGKSAQEAA
ncbi:hypothetical protein VTN00DRAFT_690 [Thermoascus crustaceus]|uniref:uncharacterized protein n=1 Tax=Thermoascus crustaceus TaxID=5088 RepID=UPI0037423C8D